MSMDTGVIDVSKYQRRFFPTLLDYSRVGMFNGFILCNEAALSYYDLCDHDLYLYPIFYCVGDSPRTLYGGEPALYMVSELPPCDCIEDTMFAGIRVVKPHIALCELIEFNPDAEMIVQAIDAADKELMVLVREEAKKRGIEELLDWEIKETKEYFEWRDKR